MLIKNRFLKYFSFLLSALFIAYVIYIIISSFFIVKNQFIDIGEATYVNQVRSDDYTIKLADFLTKNCKGDKTCEVQSMLDFVTAIPYKINEGTGGTVLVNLEIFDNYMEQFRQPVRPLKEPLYGQEEGELNE